MVVPLTPEGQVQVLLRENKRLIADKNELYWETVRLRADLKARDELLGRLVESETLVGMAKYDFAVNRIRDAARDLVYKVAR